jgi:hypothetical protein
MATETLYYVFEAQVPSITEDAMSREDCVDYLIENWESGDGDLVGAIEFLAECDFTSHGIVSDADVDEGTDVSGAALILRGLLEARPERTDRFLELLALRGQIVLLPERDAWISKIRAACDGRKGAVGRLAAGVRHPSELVAGAIDALCAGAKKDKVD